MNNKEQSNKTNIGLRVTFYVSLCLFVLSLIVLFLCIYNTAFAEFYCRTVSTLIRQSLSYVTGFVSISIAETVLLLLPLILIFLFVLTFVKIKNRSFSLNKVSLYLGILVFISAFLFINTFAVCYFRCPLEENLELERKKADRQTVYNSAVYLNDTLKDIAENIEFTEFGSSKNPYTWSETDKIIDEGYNRLISEHRFVSYIISKPKKIFLSPLMTYTHISGIYIPFTGEANVNTNYPDYVVAFTVAHEKAHQRGIAGEDDANFAAFLALMYTGNDYMKYSALMTMYDYMLDDLYENDSDMYHYMLDNTSDKIFGEMYSYYEFFKKYSGSVASKVADQVNDTYLKTMGEDEGIMSYGRVIELFCAYMEKYKGLP